MFQGSENLEKLAHFRYVQGAGRHVQRLDPPRLHRLLRDAAGERAGAGAVPGGRPDARPAADRGEPAQPGRRGQGRDPGQRAQPPVRRVPVAQAATGHVRHVRQRATTGTGRSSTWRARPSPTRRTSSTSTTRPATRCWRSPATSTSRPATKLIETHFGDVPNRPAPKRPDFDEPDLTAERRESYTDPLAPLPAFAARLAGAGPDQRLRRLPAVRRAGRGAHRRRRVPAGPAADPAGPVGHQRRRVHRLHGRAVRGPRPDRAAAAGAPAARRRRRQGAAHDRRGVRAARHRRAATTASWPAPRPGSPPTCCASATRCSAGRCGWRCWNSSAATRP